MEQLGIDPKQLVAQIINFLVFFFVVKRFIVKPFNMFLDNEERQEKDKVDALAKAKELEKDLINQEKKIKEKSRKEMTVLLEQAKKDALSLRADMIKQAQKDADDIKIRMQKELDEEKAAMYKDVKDQVSSLSIYMVQEGLRDSLDVEAKKRITDRILKNIDKAKVMEN